MKVLGKINVGGMDVYQVSSFNPTKDKIEGAKKGSMAFVDPLEVYELTKKGWTPTTFRIMFMNLLTWATTLLNSESRTRKEIVEQVFDGIAHYKQGEISPEGQELVKSLKSDYRLIGITPSITYLMVKPRGEGSLDVFWEHPFSQPSVLLKHKELPLLIISNGNIDFDDSRLLKMGELDRVEVIEKLEGEYEFEKDKMQGISG